MKPEDTVGGMHGDAEPTRRPAERGTALVSARSELSKLVTVRNHHRPPVRARNCLRNHDRRVRLCFLNGCV